MAKMRLSEVSKQGLDNIFQKKHKNSKVDNFKFLAIIEVPISLSVIIAK